MRNDINFENKLKKRKDSLKKCFQVKEGNGTFLNFLQTENKQTGKELDVIICRNEFLQEKLNKVPYPIYIG